MKKKKKKKEENHFKPFSENELNVLLSCFDLKSSQHLLVSLCFPADINFLELLFVCSEEKGWNLREYHGWRRRCRGLVMNRPQKTVPHTR